MFLLTKLFMVTTFSSASLNLIDLEKCKLSHSGSSFMGMISKTSQGVRCQRWDYMQKTTRNLSDHKFPELSMKKAKNFCRNPSNDESGPWCYAVGPSATKQTCNIPLCNNHCRLTGPGVEYSGTISRAMTRKCEKWNLDWKSLKVKMQSGNETNGVKYSIDRFPDQNIGISSHYCRNPDGSLGGPWCYIQNEKQGVYVKRYCDIPVCDGRDGEFVSKPNDFYSHYISYKSLKPNISFAVKLWNPDDEPRAVVKILLSTLNIPTTKQNLRKWGTAVELSISNYGTGITIGNNSQFIEPTPKVLKSTHYTSFVISWENNVLNLYMSSDATESVYVEMLADSPILGQTNLTITHYSVSGDVSMWAFHSHDECQEHTTFLPTPQFLWKLRQDGVVFYLEISIRSYHSAIIFLNCDPYHDYPRLAIKIAIQKSVTEVIYQSTELSKSRITATNFSVDYWLWTKLRINLLGKEILLMKHGDEGFVSILAATHEIVDSLRWFSIGSNKSLSHWVLYCEPSDLPTAYPPDCALTVKGFDYKGDQWVTDSGLPCLPWFAVEPKFYERASDKNYCRNFNKTISGPWCYVDSSYGISPVTCNVRKCNAIICKKAGTATDYVGDLAITRSNRTCKKWPKSFLKYLKHEVYPTNFFNGNFCRNPTREIGGAWCFTTDKGLKKDLCGIKDCDKHESRIVLINHGGDSRFTYILPKWRDTGPNGGLYFSLKRWDPFIPEGMLFKIFSLNRDKHFLLYIGAEYNQELALYFKDSESNKDILLTRKPFPHLIPAGKWLEFRLQMFTGGIRLGYDTKDYTLLYYKTDESFMMFNPAFISYETIGHSVIGMYFPHLECHVENTSAQFHSRIYPISWQTDYEVPSNLTLYIRGTGIAIIPLVHFPSHTEDYLVVFVDYNNKLVSLEKNTISGVKKLCAKEFVDNFTSHTKWTRFDIFYNKNILYVFRNGTPLLKWLSTSPLVYYFFSVAARNGWIVWTANCEPPDIDSALQDGSWSPWSNWHCSISCGTGVGYRKRDCNNPKPTIFGNPCAGRPTENGVCNDFECGTISPNTYILIRKYLQTKCINLIVKEGCNVTLRSPAKIISRIKSESPSSEIKWMHEGVILNFKKNKYHISDSLVVTVNNISKFDNGMYVCILKSQTTVNTPLKVVVLTVEPRNPDVIVYNGSSIEMTCESALVTIYADLLIKWYHNDKLFTVSGIATIYFNDTLKIPQAQWNHSGIWKCILEQTDLNLMWTVQIHKVQVIQEHSLLRRSLQSYVALLLPKRIIITNMQCDQQPSKKNIMIAVILVIFLTILCGTIIYCLLQRFKKRNLTKYDALEEEPLSKNASTNNANYDALDVCSKSKININKCKKPLKISGSRQTIPGGTKVGQGIKLQIIGKRQVKDTQSYIKVGKQNRLNKSSFVENDDIENDMLDPDPYYEQDDVSHELGEICRLKESKSSEDRKTLDDEDECLEMIENYDEDIEILGNVNEDIEMLNNDDSSSSSEDDEVCTDLTCKYKKGEASCTLSTCEFLEHNAK